jgi:hypothetical protein
LSSPAITGDTYVLQATTDFIDWTTVESRVADGCTVEYLLPESGDHRFYRLERQPAP